MPTAAYLVFKVWQWSGQGSLMEAAVLHVLCLSPHGLPGPHSLADIPSALPVAPAAAILLLSSFP